MVCFENVLSFFFEPCHWQKVHHLNLITGHIEIFFSILTCVETAGKKDFDLGLVHSILSPCILNKKCEEMHFTILSKGGSSALSNSQFSNNSDRTTQFSGNICPSMTISSYTGSYEINLWQTGKQKESWKKPIYWQNNKGCRKINHIKKLQAVWLWWKLKCGGLMFQDVARFHTGKCKYC